MATRSSINFYNPETRKIYNIYCHYDGYPDAIGYELVAHFNNAATAKELIATGDLRSIEDGHAEPFKDGDPAAELKTLNDVQKVSGQMGASYIYIFFGDAWYCYNLTGRNFKLVNSMNWEELERQISADQFREQVQVQVQESKSLTEVERMRKLMESIPNNNKDTKMNTKDMRKLMEAIETNNIGSLEQWFTAFVDNTYTITGTFDGPYASDELEDELAFYKTNDGYAAYLEDGNGTQEMSHFEYYYDGGYIRAYLKGEEEDPFEFDSVEEFSDAVKVYAHKRVH
jgi:hypothetical protein